MLKITPEPELEQWKQQKLPKSKPKGKFILKSCSLFVYD